MRKKYKNTYQFFMKNAINQSDIIDNVFDHLCEHCDVFLFNLNHRDILFFFARDFILKYFLYYT